MMSALFAAAMLGMAAAPGAPPDVETFGIGASTCAEWQSGAVHEREGEAWLLGYWSALNRLNSANGMVGGEAGGGAIIAAVAKNCSDNLGERLDQATYAAYVSFQASHR